MNIALVCPYDLGVPGGVQDQVIRLARWLDDRGHSPKIVGPGTEGPEDAVLIGGTVLIQANRSSTPIALDPRTTRRLKDAVAGADVIHIHEPFMPLVSTSAVRISNVATVGTFHADAPRWARFGYKVGSGVWRRLLGRLDVITTVSHVSASAISPFSNPRVIPNGIDTADYGRGEKRTNRVAFLGRDDERKGLQVMLDAWPHVREHIPEAELRVIGAERDDTIPGVAFLGRVSEATKLEELSSAEVYCAPNLGGESFGIVVVEGMASGCAIVASAIPAFVSVLDGSGELIAPGDSGALAQRILSLLNDRRHLESRQAAAVEAAARFDGQAVADRYIAAYDDAIASHSR